MRLLPRWSQSKCAFCPEGAKTNQPKGNALGSQIADVFLP